MNPGGIGWGKTRGTSGSKKTCARAAETFRRYAEAHWAHLSRLTNMLIILNISLFFLTELVARENYFYTYYSLFFLGVVYLGLLLPLGLLERLWYYLLLLVAEAVGIYFLLSSVVFWITRTQSG